MKDVIRLRRWIVEHPAETDASRSEGIGARLDTPWDYPQPRQLIKRLCRHRHDLLTFLDHSEVPIGNNLAERAIHPAVIIRKMSYGHRSDHGADARDILISIFSTLKMLGHNPVWAC